MNERLPVIEVAFATPEKQLVVEVSYRQGISVAEAILESDIQAEFEGHDLMSMKKGIWGQPTRDGAILSPGDRVEIYRPLINDPKEARRRRAAQAKEEKL